jgi:hypothetical protein
VSWRFTGHPPDWRGLRRPNGWPYCASSSRRRREWRGWFEHDSRCSGLPTLSCEGASAQDIRKQVIDTHPQIGFCTACAPNDCTRVNTDNGVCHCCAASMQC